MDGKVGTGKCQLNAEWLRGKCLWYHAIRRFVCYIESCLFWIWFSLVVKHRVWIIYVYAQALCLIYYKKWSHVYCCVCQPVGKRGWKMFYATLRDMVIYLHKDEHGFKKSALVADNLSNCIRIHHALATKATDYKKKQHVFRLQTSDWAQYLFQTRWVIVSCLQNVNQESLGSVSAVMCCI